MAKQKNRKKALKLEMKRNGLLKKAGQVFDKAVESVEKLWIKPFLLVKILWKKAAKQLKT